MTTIGWLAGPVVVAVLVAGCSRGDEDTVDRSAKVPVALVLEVDTAAFDRAAAATSDPSQPAAFLTLQDIASEYGAPDDTISAATTQLRDRGLDVQADPSGSVLWGTVDVADAEELFGVGFETLPLDGGGQRIRPTGTPKVPEGVDGVRAVVGLSATLRADGDEDGSTSTSSTSPLPACPGGQVTRAGLAGTYGVEQPVAQGRTGAGVTIAMVEIESFDSRVFQTYDACTAGALDQARVSQTSVEPAPPPTPGSEVALDTVAIGLLAPGAAQQITRFDPASSIVFPLLSIMTAAGQGATPEILLSTVGFCEDARSDDEIALGERLLATFALSGTTTVVSSGDVGSSSCHPGSDDPAVQYPASSAWVTSIGGASFDGTAAAPTGLTVWNDTPGSDNAGGGGVSTKVARPAWQTGTNVDGDRRAVPDLAAFASPGGVGLVPTCDDSSCDWQGLGGTSLAGAAVAGALALLLEPPADAGGATGSDTSAALRVGHLAPLLAGSAGQVATDVTDGDNQVFTDQCCAAAAGYDMASGWGLVDLTGLVGAAGARG